MSTYSTASAICTSDGEAVDSVPSRRRRSSELLIFEVDVRHCPWTLSEDYVIAEAYALFGPNWSKIQAEYLPHRSVKAINLHWNDRRKERPGEGPDLLATYAAMVTAKAAADCAQQGVRARILTCDAATRKQLLAQARESYAAQVRMYSGPPPAPPAVAAFAVALDHFKWGPGQALMAAEAGRIAEEAARAGPRPSWLPASIPLAALPHLGPNAQAQQGQGSAAGAKTACADAVPRAGLSQHHLKQARKASASATGCPLPKRPRRGGAAGPSSSSLGGALPLCGTPPLPPLAPVPSLPLPSHVTAAPSYCYAPNPGPYYAPAPSSSTCSSGLSGSIGGLQRTNSLPPPAPPAPCSSSMSHSSGLSTGSSYGGRAASPVPAPPAAATPASGQSPALSPLSLPPALLQGFAAGFAKGLAATGGRGAASPAASLLAAAAASRGHATPSTPTPALAASSGAAPGVSVNGSQGGRSGIIPTSNAPSAAAAAVSAATAAAAAAAVVAGAFGDAVPPAPTPVSANAPYSAAPWAPSPVESSCCYGGSGCGGPAACSQGLPPRRPSPAPTPSHHACTPAADTPGSACSSDEGYCGEYGPAAAAAPTRPGYTAFCGSYHQQLQQQGKELGQAMGGPPPAAAAAAPSGQEDDDFLSILDLVGEGEEDLAFMQLELELGAGHGNSGARGPAQAAAASAHASAASTPGSHLCSGPAVGAPIQQQQQALGELDLGVLGLAS